MKIAFIVQEFPKLSETFILNQITGLIDRGHMVDIYALGRGDFSTIHNEVISYGLMGHTYYREAPRNKILRLLKAARIVTSTIVDYPMATLGSLNVFRYGKEAASLSLLYLVRLWVDKAYDIIQCHFGPTGFVGLGMRRLISTRSKVVVSFHGFDMSSYIRTRSANVYKGLFEKIDFALPISEYWKEKLVNLGCPRDKVLVHRMGVDCNKFTFQPRSLHDGEPVKIITVARLVEKKGLEYGIRAVNQLRDRFTNIYYGIVGDGPLRDELNKLIKRLGAEDSIFILGQKTQEEVQEVLRKSHLFLHPSVTSANGDQEGIPVGLMEAMAVGLPIVSTYHSGIPELVQNGNTGFLVPERDVGALANRLVYLSQHPDTWAEMGRAGRAYVEANYNIDKLNDRLVDIYNGLIADHSHDPPALRAA